MRFKVTAFAIAFAALIVVEVACGQSAIDPRAEQLWQESRGKTYAEALPYLQEAARLGHPRAQSALAHFYWGRQDYAQAAHWNQLAASQGVREAQFNLAGMYTQGLGVPVDLRKAAELLEASARQNYAPAEEALGICFEFGEGVARSRPYAISWLDKAAAQGDRTALQIVGWLKNPSTPAFRDESQLSAYIAAQTQRSAPRPGHSGFPGVDSSLHPVCGNAGVAAGSVCQGYGGGLMTKPN